MSVIAWDGNHLAADRQMTAGTRRATCSKLRGTIAWCGDQEEGILLADWYTAGADPEKWPAWQTNDNFTILVVAKEGACYFYEARPREQLVMDPFFAFGSGAPYALGAMAMGATAREAVEVASRFDIYCGMGVDPQFHP